MITKRFYQLFFLLFCCFPVVLSGQQTGPFTIEQVLSAPFPGDLTAAPAGDRIAWVFDQEGVRNIWISDGPGAGARRVTDYDTDDGQAIGSLTFTPDGEHIIYVHGGAPNRRGEIPNPTSDPEGAKRQLYSIDISGGSPKLLGEGYAPLLHPAGRELTFLHNGQVWTLDLNDPEAKPKQLFQMRGSAGNLHWSPDGKTLAFVSNRGDHAFLGLFDLEERRIRWPAPSVDNDSDPVWSPDGGHIAWLRFPNEKQQLPFAPRREGLPWSILSADANTGATDTLWTAPKGPGSAFRGISADRQLFWTDNGYLVFPYEGSGWMHLWTIPAGGGQARDLMPADFEVQYVSLHPDGNQLYYSSNQNDINRQHIWRVNPAADSPEQITEGEGIEWAPVITAGGQLAVLASGATDPAHPHWVDGEGELTPVAPETIPDDWPRRELVDPMPVIFSAADGMPIHGQLFRPKNIPEGERRPALLFFHGGSRRQMLLGFHHRGYYHNAYALNQYLASQGYIVLSVNYRSGTGYGMEFREAINYGARGASEFQDVLGAGLYLRSRDDVAPNKIGLWGGSYGGYLTALGLARASDLFAAGVDIHGVHDWNVVIRNFVPSYNPNAREELARLAYESSPMAYVNTWRSPVLLIHGDDDRNVPFSESVDVAESLRRQGVHFEQLIFPDEVHGFLLYRNWLAAYRATAGFFKRMLRER